MSSNNSCQLGKAALFLLGSVSVPATLYAADTSSNYLDFSIVGTTSVDLNHDCLIASGPPRVGGGELNIRNSFLGGSIQSTNDLSVGREGWVRGDASSNGDLNVGNRSQVAKTAAVGSGNLSSQGNMVLGKDTTIFGDVTFDGTLTKNNNVDIKGAEINGGADLVPNIVLPVIGILPAGVIDISEANNTGPHELAPGAYHDVTFGRGNTVILSEGDYSFNDLEFRTATAVVFDVSGGKVNLNINGDLTIGKSIQQSVIGGNPSKVSYRFAPGANADIGSNSDVAGTFFGPDSALKFGKSISLNGAAYASEVAFGTNCTVFGQPQALVPPPLTVDSFVMLATGPITLGQNSVVHSGDVGSEDEFNGGKNVDINDDADSVSRTLAPDATLADGGHYDVVATDNLVTSGTVTIDDQTIFAGLPPSNTWPTAGTCTPGVDNVTLNNASPDKTIATGDYNDIIINTGTTGVVFAGGTYNVKKLRINSNADVQFAADTTFCITNEFFIGDSANVNTATPDEVIVEYTGTADASVRPGVTSAFAFVGQNATLDFASGGDHTGAYVAKEITANTDNEFTHDSPF